MQVNTIDINYITKPRNRVIDCVLPKPETIGERMEAHLNLRRGFIWGNSAHRKVIDVRTPVDLERYDFDREELADIDEMMG